MCSTIRPLPLHHCFGLFQRNRVWKAPTNIFHQSLELPRMVQPVSRAKGQKCARLSAPSMCTTVLLCFKGNMYAKPQLVPFNTALNCQEWCDQFRDPRVKSVLDYPPPPSTPLFWFVSESPNQYLSQFQKETVYGKPQPVSFTRALNCQEWSNQFRDPRVKVCSTIRPLPLHHCFGLFQRNRVCKAPTGTFHESLELPGMIQLASRSKGQKCARLSAPSLCTTALVCFNGTVYGKPQRISFTRALNCQEWSNQFREPRVKSVLDYPPPPCVPLFCFISKETCMQSPN